MTFFEAQRLGWPFYKSIITMLQNLASSEGSLPNVIKSRGHCLSIYHGTNGVTVL